MTIRYFILDGDHFVSEDFLDREHLLDELPFCKSGAKVWGVSSVDPAHPIELTAGIIAAGHAEQRWTATEIRESVLGDYIVLPVSREEQRADDEERERDWRSGK